jgi:hypothetical protein
LKIAVYLQTVLFALVVLLVGCSQQGQPPPPKADPLNSHAEKKAATIVVPPNVVGRWKAVKIAVIDKSKVSQKIYTIPIGGKQAIPASRMTVKAETFLPAFTMEGTTMTSSSNELKNPGVKVQIVENGTTLFSGWLFSKFPNTHAFMHPRYGFTLVDVVPADK